MLQWEGSIKGEHDQALGAAVTVIWVVLIQAFGS